MRQLIALIFGIMFIVSCGSTTKDNASLNSDTQNALGKDAKVEQDYKALNITLDDILFAFNKVNLTSKGEKVIDKLAEVMDKYPNTIVNIVGNSDNIGPDWAKAKIAKGRAKTVATYLKDKGIKASRISYKGVSDSNPKVANNSTENRQKNRRVDLRLEFNK